jgi:hypothetical protein
MEYLEETGGYGWWGNNANKEFYENLKGSESPWNWIRVVRLLSDTVDKNGGQHGDHAGIYECSMLESLFPNIIKKERLRDTDDWFAQSAKDMDVKLGDEIIDGVVNGIIDMIKE